MVRKEPAKRKYTVSDSWGLTKFKSVVSRELQRAIRMERADDDGNCECVCCGRVQHYTDMDCGHFIDGKANAIRNLDKDYKHEFEEHFGVLPNGLFAYYLSAADGKQANTAPDNVASDGDSLTPDRRVHAASSCVGVILTGEDCNPPHTACTRT